MRHAQSSFLHKQLTVMAGLAMAAAVVSLPQNASANTSADATIINVATVAYKDSAGQGNWSALAASKVTVNKVAAAPSLYAAPSGAGPYSLPDCPGTADYSSGTTVTRVYALAANANGKDTYSLSIADGAGTANVSSIARTISTLTSSGAVDVNPASTRDLGGAIPIGFTAPNILRFPGGALTSNGFADGDLVLVQLTSGQQLFKISTSGVSNGVAPNNSYADATFHTDTAATVTGETLGTLTLEAVPNTTMFGQSIGGGNVAPAFGTDAPVIGVPVGEVVLVKVDISASTTIQAPLTTAKVGYTFSTGAPDKVCTVDHFQAPTLSIKKEARNVSTSGTFSATATGNPGQILEYQVTVTNSGSQASLVNVSDAVPAYTTLVTGATYGSGSGNIFAQITDNNTPTARTVSLTTTVNDETQPAGSNVGFGDASGTTATSLLHFFLGANSVGSTSTGGKLPYCSDGSALSAIGACATGNKITTLTILYQVKID